MSTILLNCACALGLNPCLLDVGILFTTSIALEVACGHCRYEIHGALPKLLLVILSTLLMTPSTPKLFSWTYSPVWRKCQLNDAINLRICSDVNSGALSICNVMCVTGAFPRCVCHNGCDCKYSLNNVNLQYTSVLVLMKYRTIKPVPASTHNM